jgi:dethiobiotin synthetase
MCERYKIPVKGIVINNFDTNGYNVKELKRDLENLTNMSVLGTIPFIDDMSDTSLYRVFKKNIDFKSLLN